MWKPVLEWRDRVEGEKRGRSEEEEEGARGADGYLPGMKECVRERREQMPRSIGVVREKRRSCISFGVLVERRKQGDDDVQGFEGGDACGALALGETHFLLRGQSLRQWGPPQLKHGCGRGALLRGQQVLRGQSLRQWGPPQLKHGSGGGSLVS